MQLTAKGLLRRRTVIAYASPVLFNRPVVPLQLLDRLGLAEVAAALGVAAAALPGMADDDPVRHGLAACALRDGDAGIALDLLRGMEAPFWPGDVSVLGAAFAALPPGARQDFAAAAFRPDHPSDVGDFRAFAALLGAPLRRETAARLLASPGWANLVDTFPGNRDGDHSFLFAAALMPASLAGAFAGSIDTILAARRPRATLLLAFLDELAALKDTP